MKRINKFLTAFLVAAMALVLSLAALTGCGSEKKTYSVEFDNLIEWDYCFVTINYFGETEGVGMVNLDMWGRKKLKQDSTGEIAGTGLSWTVTLTVDGSEYVLDIIAHLVCAGGDYRGSGDLTYEFTGKYTEVEGGYKLEKPTYILVTQDGDITISDEQKADDFAMSLNESPFMCDSEGNGEDSRKIIGSRLDTVFFGATFMVEGDSIISVEDIIYE